MLGPETYAYTAKRYTFPYTRCWSLIARGNQAREQGNGDRDEYEYE